MSGERAGGADAAVRDDGDHGCHLPRLPGLDQIDGSVGDRVPPAVAVAASGSSSADDAANSGPGQVNASRKWQRSAIEHATGRPVTTPRDRTALAAYVFGQQEGLPITSSR